MLVTASGDKTIRIWDTRGKKAKVILHCILSGFYVELSLWHILKRIFWIFSFLAGKCVNVVNTKGENINICWSPDGNTIAVGNKVCPSFICNVCLVWSFLPGIRRSETGNEAGTRSVPIFIAMYAQCTYFYSHVGAGYLQHFSSFNFIFYHQEDLITFVDAKTYKPKCDEQFRFEVSEFHVEQNLPFLETSYFSIFFTNRLMKFPGTMIITCSS
jgi:hypothetical protein